MKILFLTGSRSDPPSRFRIWQFVEPLTAMGHQVKVRVPSPNRTWSSELRGQSFRQVHTRCGAAWRILSVLWNLRDAREYDIIMMNRDLVPDPRIAFIEPWLAKRNPRLVFDFDDAIHIGSRERKLRKILPLFAWVTPGNPYLAEFARQANKNVSVWPTVVNTDHYRPTTQRRPGPIRIGWSGSNSTAKYCLPILEEPLCQMATTQEFEFIIICNSDPRIRWQNVRSRFIPWTPDTEIAGLHEIDLGLMPLKDEAFERGKCGLKAIQYMGIGIPGLVSPVGVNSEIVLHGKDGYHCRTAEEWVRYASHLIQNPDLRIDMGVRARKRAVENYSVQSLLPKMTATFQQIAKGKRSSS